MPKRRKRTKPEGAINHKAYCLSRATIATQWIIITVDGGGGSSGRCPVLFKRGLVGRSRGD